jgi:exopolysaccharide production protein ExoQ
LPLNSRYNSLLVLVFIVFSTGAGIYLFQTEQDDPSSLLTQLVLAGLYAVCFYLIFINYGIKKIRLNWLIILLCYATISVYWSIDPLLSIRKLLGLFGVYILALFSLYFFDLKYVLKLIFWFFFVAICLSVFVAVLMPEFGTSEFFKGAWNGIYTHKNKLGRYSSLFLVLSIYLYSCGQLGKNSLIKLIFATLLGLSTLVLAESITSLFTAALTITFAFSLHLMPKKGAAKVILPLLILIICIPSAFFLFSNLEMILGFAGKDITLTGRVPLWGLLIFLSLSNPIQGFGYNGFWIRETESPSNTIVDLLGWHPTHAHNGFVDIYLNLGLVGLSIFLIAIGRLFLYVKKSDEKISLNSRFLLIIFILLYNLTESTFIASNGFMWYLFLLISFSYEPSFKRIQAS